MIGRNSSIFVSCLFLYLQSFVHSHFIKGISIQTISKQAKYSCKIKSSSLMVALMIQLLKVNYHLSQIKHMKLFIMSKWRFMIWLVAFVFPIFQLLLYFIVFFITFLQILRNMILIQLSITLKNNIYYSKNLIEINKFNNKYK